MKMQRLMMIVPSLALSAAMITAGCDEGRRDNPPSQPPQGGDQSQDKDKTSQNDQAQRDQAKSQDQQKQDQQKAEGQTGTGKGPNQQQATDNNNQNRDQNAQVPTAPVPNKKTVSAALSPQDDELTIALTRYLMVDSPQAIADARTKVVDEIFQDEDEAQGKILEVKASVAKLFNADLYSQELKNRVGFLQSGIQDRVEENKNYDILEKGVFIAGSSALLGTLAGLPAFRYAYNNYPQAVTSMKNGFNSAKNAVVEKTNAVVTSSRNAIGDVRSTLTDRQRLNATLGSTRASLRQAKNEVMSAARKPFRGTEEILRDNLEDLGVSFANRTAMNPLTPVNAPDVPFGTTFLPTPKSNFHYAPLSEWNGENLGVNRVLLFKQERLLRGSSLDTYYVTPPLPADQVGEIARHLIPQPGAPASRQWVHFVNLRTGAVSATRWTKDKFNNMLTRTGATIRPLFSNFDTPTAVGTGVTSAALSSVLYWYGFDEGQNNAHQSDAANLESMIPPKGAGNQQVSQGQ